MTLFETLREFKKIAPDASFTEKSKRAVLATPQNVPAMSPFRGVLQFIETGAALVLAGFFMLLITGAFSGSTYIAPVQYSVIDPAGLHAEAQAIDMQIQLAQVNYTEGVAAPASTMAAAAATSSALSTSMTAATPKPSAMSVAGVSSSSAPLATSSAATTTSISIDAALTKLTQ